MRELYRILKMGSLLAFSLLIIVIAVQADQSIESDRSEQDLRFRPPEPAPATTDYYYLISNMKEHCESCEAPLKIDCISKIDADGQVEWQKCTMYNLRPISRQEMSTLALSYDRVFMINDKDIILFDEDMARETLGLWPIDDVFFRIMSSRSYQPLALNYDEVFRTTRMNNPLALSYDAVFGMMDDTHSLQLGYDEVFNAFWPPSLPA
jgi:hypothetical protein